MKIDAYNADEIKKLGTILGVWAHPDDETFSMGGLIAMACQNGQRVVCLTATKGEKGSADEQRWPLQKIAAIREKELKRALGALGQCEHHWLGYIDGECAKVPEAEACSVLRNFVTEIQPDTVITFPPDGLTGHPDHQAASRWIKTVLRDTDSPAQLYYAVDTQENYDQYMRQIDEKFNVYFAIDEPTLYPENSVDLLIDLPEPALEKKLKALLSQESQVLPMADHFGKKMLAAAMRRESFMKPENIRNR